MKQFITTITVLFVALLFPNNGKANACHTAANGLFNKFNPAVQTHLETDSVVEVEALADGDTIYRYVYKPIDLGAIPNPKPQKQIQGNAFRANRPSGYGIPDFPNYTQSDRYVGKIPFQEGVSPTGGKTYSIPITTAYCCGAAPQISIVYNSQSANGTAGYGWNIAGVSAILTVGKTIMYDGVTSPVNLTDPDECRFTLDGVRLVPNTGQQRQYQYETSKGFILVKKHLYGDHVAYFTVAYPNGNTATFGFKDNTNTRYAYPLTELTDLKGYKANFTYIEVGNCYYLSKVTYGGKTEVEHSGQLLFHYADRPDFTTTYLDGMAIAPSRLLKEVVSQTKVNGKIETLCTYSLTHVLKEVNLLTRIDCSSGESALPPLQFDYGDGKDNQHGKLRRQCDVLLTEYFKGETNGAKPLFVRGKFVKNQFADGLLTMPGHFNQYQQTGQLVVKKFLSSTKYYAVFGSGYPVDQDILIAPNLSSSSGMSTIKTESGFQTIQAVDTNGDGVDELVKVNFGDLVGGNTLLKITTYTYEKGKFESKTFTVPAMGVVDNEGKTYSPMSRIYLFGDFMGTGKAQLLTISHNKTFLNKDIPSWSTLIDLDSQQRLSETSPISLSFYSKAFALDVDGDGKVELCHATREGMEVYKFSVQFNKFVKWFTSKSLTFGNLENAAFGDINGDGKIDVLVPPADSYMDIERQTLPVWMPSSCPDCGEKEPIRGPSLICSRCKADLTKCYKGPSRCRACGSALTYPPSHLDNGAPRCPTHGVDVEVVLNKGYQDNGNVWNVYLSTGRGFVRREMPIANREKDDKYLMMDVDKNGYADLLCMRKGYVQLFTNNHGVIPHTSCCSLDLSQNAQLLPANVNNLWGMSHLVAIENAKVTCYRFTENESNNRLLTAMANSHGIVQQNDYGDMTDGRMCYTPSNTLRTYPYYDLMAPLNILLNSGTYLDRKLVKHLRYTYEGAVAHRTGMGFIGFEKTRVNEDVGGNYVMELRDPEQFGITTHVETRDKEMYMFYNKTWLAMNKTCNPVLTHSLEINKLTGVNKETQLSYDIFNNPTKERVSLGAGLYTETTQTYRNVVTPERYFIGLPLTKTTTSGRDGNTWTTREEYAYNAQWMPERSVTYTNGNKTDETRWTYDAHGNVTSEKSAPYNVTELLGNTYTYDAIGRNLLTKTNALGQTTTYAEYDKWGQAHRITDHKGRTTTIVTDAWGKPVSTTSPDGITTTITTAWGGKGLYTIAKTITGKPETIVHYDALERDVRKGNMRLDGKWQFVDNAYDYKGRLAKTSLPFKGDAPALWNTYEYDDYDRLVKQTEASGKTTTWSYAGLSVTETKEGIASTKTTDAIGELIKVEDPGGTITYTLRPDGQPSAITAPGNVTTTFEYDGFGRRTAIVDPSAGRRSFSESYSADGVRTVVETNADGRSITSTYDKFGRATGIRRPEFNTAYTYNADGLLVREESTNGTSSEFTYDDNDRLATSRENVQDGKFLQKQYQYGKGNVTSISYASKRGNLCQERFEYANGYNVEIKLDDGKIVWKQTEENDLGQSTRVESGVLERKYNYTETGLPRYCSFNGIIAEYDHYPNFGFDYEFDAQTGNLLNRTNNRYKRIEGFNYDNLNRLEKTDRFSEEPDVVYSANGNIVKKQDVGALLYGNTAKPYQVTSVTPLGTAVPLRDQRITYTSFMRPKRIEENGYTASFDYTADAYRTRMIVTHGTGRLLTRYYIGGRYECDVDSMGSEAERFYIGGDAYTAPAVLISHDGSVGIIYQIVRDYLGSIVYITDDKGYLKQELDYDAWGRLRKPHLETYYEAGSEPELLLGRGYCGHEHLPWFGLINMNARLYDPVLGRFLSPDPYVQMPDFTQNFNRYSYCLNNPLKYVDRDGKNPIIIIGIVAGAFLGGVVANHGELNPFSWNWSQVTTYLGVVVGGVVGYACAYGIVNPGTFGYIFGVSNAFGAAGLTIGAAGSLSNWNFRWTTAAGGGGNISINFNEIASKRYLSDSRFFHGSEYEASKLLVAYSKMKGVEAAKYKTAYGYYFEETEGYFFSKEVVTNNLTRYIGTRPDGNHIYYMSNTKNGGKLYHIIDKVINGVSYPYLDLGLGQQFEVSEMDHTHPGNTSLSPDDSYQGIIPVHAIGWDGIKRDALKRDESDGSFWYGEVQCRPKPKSHKNRND